MLNIIFCLSLLKRPVGSRTGANHVRSSLQTHTCERLLYSRDTVRRFRRYWNVVSPDPWTTLSRPSSLDIIIASHLLPLIHAPLPNPLLKTLLLESYPLLVSHACLVHSHAFPTSLSIVRDPPVVQAHVSNVSRQWTQGIGRVIASACHGLSLYSQATDDVLATSRLRMFARFALTGFGAALPVIASGLVWINVMGRNDVGREGEVSFTHTTVNNLGSTA